MDNNNIRELAIAAYQSGDLQTARQHFSSLLSEPKEAGEGYYGLGLLAYRNDEFQKAEDLFNLSLPLSESKENVHYYLGECKRKQGDISGAKACYKLVLETHPDHKGARRMLSQLSGPAPSTVDQAEGEINAGNPELEKMRPAESDLVSRLSRDDSEVAKSILRLIGEASFDIKPSARAFVGHAFSGAIKRLIGWFALAFVLGFMWNFVTAFLTSAGSGQATPSDFFSISSRLIALSLAIGAIVAITWFVAALATSSRNHYVFAGDRIIVRTGLFRFVETTTEVFRVTEVRVSQGLVSRVLDVADLVLNTQDSSRRTLMLIGFGSMRETQDKAASMRELIAQLRTVPWVKGVIE